MRHRRRHALTLLELLVVVGIVAILSTVGFVHVQLAQTRAKVGAALANTRTVSHALEAYAVDHNSYPPALPRYPGDPLGVLADHQLAALTTPVAYLTSAEAMRDPFGQVRVQVFQTDVSGAGGQSGDFPRLQPPNPQRSLLYFHYPSLAARFGEAALGLNAAGVISIGPDQRDSMGAYALLPPDVFRHLFFFTPFSHPLDTIYDPTNGTVSEGDLGCFAGCNICLQGR
ncbi:MAG: hypothetical protein Kow0059_19150 [Candidatus Sumerlaeia bacterium]